MSARVPKVILVGPTPPPTHGVSQAIGWLVDSPTLADGLQILHLDTSDRRSSENLGRVDLENIIVGLRNVRDMIKLCARERPCLIYYTLSQNTPALLRDAALVTAARLFGARSVVQLAGSRYPDTARAGGPAGLLTRWALERATLVLVLGRSQIRSILPVMRHNRVDIAPNGLPIPAIECAGDYRRDPCHFLFLGSLTANKGLLVALDALHLVSETCREFVTTFAGAWANEQQRRMILAAVEEYGLSQVVRFPGIVQGDRKLALFREADVYLLPSLAEGQPISIIEAMAFGLPVISTRVGAVPDTVVDGVSGVLVEPGDARTLAEAMIRLIDNADARASMGMAGTSLYLEHFTLQRSHEILRERLLHAAHVASAGCSDFGAEQSTHHAFHWSKKTRR